MKQLEEKTGVKVNTQRNLVQKEILEPHDLDYPDELENYYRIIELEILQELRDEGFLLDDLSISAIGYEEDFENGDGGWIAEGFVRLYNHLPQTYRLALIERGDEISVREVELDAENRAQISLEFGDEIEDVILVVTATSRFSWLPANYHIQIVP